jgi:hypothetical protein
MFLPLVCVALVLIAAPPKKPKAYAKPEAMLGAPLPVRFGPLEEKRLDSPDQYSKIIEWKMALSP